MVQVKELEKRAVEIRKRTVEIIYRASGGHTGGSLSEVDILVALHFGIMNIDPKNPDMKGRDRFILSKGHSVEGYYSTLESRGFISVELLDSYGKFNSLLAGHPTRKVPGIELNSGALGHGLSVGVGLALAAKRSAENFRTYVLMGDGEHGEGSIMEAVAAAGHYRLNNLVAIVDRNQLQISGRIENVMAIDDLEGKYKACGWSVVHCDGHNIEALLQCFRNAVAQTQKPTCVIAHTVKGKGVSFMEDKAFWHHKTPTDEQLELAFTELNQRMEEIENA
ncbi:MAG: transketolase [Bacteroidia bacterium]|nr:transketolase [Bacteroidia bacterium]